MPASEPAVIAGTVISTVAGEHTAAGFVITRFGNGLMVTTTGLTAIHPAAVVPLI